MKTKAPDYAKVVEMIHESAVQKLGPYGILVEHSEPDVPKRPHAYHAISDFTLKIPDPDKSRLDAYQELTVHVIAQDVWECSQDAKHFDCLSQMWARLCADYAPTLFENAPPPPAGDVDWRPDETLPEDFYAA